MLGGSWKMMNSTVARNVLAVQYSNLSVHLEEKQHNNIIVK